MDEKDKPHRTVCKLDSRNRITLPKYVLEKLRLKSNDYVLLENNNNEIHLLKAIISARRNNYQKTKVNEEGGK